MKVVFVHVSSKEATTAATRIRLFVKCYPVFFCSSTSGEYYILSLAFSDAGSFTKFTSSSVHCFISWTAMVSEYSILYCIKTQVLRFVGQTCWDYLWKCFEALRQMLKNKNQGRWYCFEDFVLTNWLAFPGYSKDKNGHRAARSSSFLCKIYKTADLVYILFAPRLSYRTHLWNIVFMLAIFRTITFYCFSIFTRERKCSEERRNCLVTHSYSLKVGRIHHFRRFHTRACCSMWADLFGQRRCCKRMAYVGVRKPCSIFPFGGWWFLDCGLSCWRKV